MDFQTEKCRHEKETWQTGKRDRIGRPCAMKLFYLSPNLGTVHTYSILAVLMGHKALLRGLARLMAERRNPLLDVVEINGWRAAPFFVAAALTQGAHHA
jgi:hypothetical protein